MTHVYHFSLIGGCPNPILLLLHLFFFKYPSQQSNAVVSDKTDTKKKKSMITSSCKPHLINTLIEESQAGVFIADKRALLYEAAEHLGLDHERVEPLMGAVPALQEA